MSKQSPPTYNIYFVGGSLSRSSGTLSSSPRPATPEVIASVQASSSHFQPDVSAPRRPPLPPGRFSNSAPVAAAARPRLPAAPISVAPGPPRPLRAPIILKEARSNARDRSLYLLEVDPGHQLIVLIELQASHPSGLKDLWKDYPALGMPKEFGKLHCILCML